MAPVSNNPVSWEVHFLWVCGRRLSLALSKEKEQFEEDFSQLYEKQPTMIGQFERLKYIVNNLGVPTRKHEYPFTAFIKNFREEFSDLIGEKLHWYGDNLFMDGSCYCHHFYYYGFSWELCS